MVLSNPASEEFEIVRMLLWVREDAECAKAHSVKKVLNYLK